MIKLLGSVMVILCGAAAGMAAANAERERFEALGRTAEMLLQFSIMIEYESPTVDEMLRRTNACCEELPKFMRTEPADRDHILKELELDPDGFAACDKDRLREYFMLLGSADKPSELERTAALRAYFIRRTDTLHDKSRDKIKLCRTLGVLGGIFAAVMLA